MRALAVASCLSLLAAAPVAAQEAPLMPTPPPTDFTKPFQYDRAPFYDPGLRLPLPAEDVALPVEIIGRDELIASGTGVSTLNLRNFGTGVRKIPPAEVRLAAPVQAKETPVAAPHCYFDRGESIDLEGRALSCRGTLTVRTHDDPGP